MEIGEESGLEIWGPRVKGVNIFGVKIQKKKSILALDWNVKFVKAYKRQIIETILYWYLKS